MKQRKPSEQFTPLELEVIRILWETGPVSVLEVHRRIQAVRPLAYNTVQTVLTILHRKGKVKRATQNRAYIYSPLVTQEKAAGHAVRDLVDSLFGGRPEALVMSMIRGRQLSRDQLDDLRRMVDESGVQSHEEP
jgi:predicted transcriptional regulator